MRHALLPIACLTLVAAAPDPHPARLVGRYDGGQAEIAAGLELRADGRFVYGLSYGALDEQGAGTWATEEGRVLLTSEPKVVPPRFLVESDTAEINGGLFVTLADPAILQGTRLGLLLVYGDVPPRFVEAEEDGRIAFPDSRRPIAIVPQLPVFDSDPTPIPLAGKSGHRLVLRFAANDIGKADFDATPLAIERGALLLDRHGRTLRFVRR